MNKRVEYIDIVRGLCIIYMIAGHIDFNSVEFDHYIHAFHMPIFFIVSGYFYKDKNISIKKALKNLSKKLLLPYFIWSIVAIIINNYTILGNHSGLINDLIIILTTNNDVIPISGALWFLTSFFFSNIIFLTIHKMIKNIKIKYILTLIIMIIGVFLDSKFELNLWWSLNSALTGVGIMSIGKFLKEKNILNRINIKNYILIFIILFFNGYLIMKTSYVNMRTNTYPIIIMFIINIIISFIIYSNLAKKMDNNKNINVINKNIKILGKESIIPLCLNQLVIKIITTLYDFLEKQFIFLNNSYIILATRYLILIFSVMIILLLTKIITKTKLKILFGK